VGMDRNHAHSTPRAAQGSQLEFVFPHHHGSLRLPDRGTQQFSGKAARASLIILPSIAILSLAAVAVGVITFERWGKLSFWPIFSITT
jgi:hypothetical protein